MGLLDPPPFTPAAAGRVVAPGVTLTNPRGLRRWSAALSDAMFGTAVCTVAGDSISVGVGSDGSSGTTSAADATYRTAGYVAQLRSLFAATYGDPGEGFIGGFTDNAGRWVGGGGASWTASIGPYESGMRAGTGQTLTISTPACTQIDLYQWNGSNATSSYTVDGGASVSMPTGSGLSTSTTYTKVSITGLANTAHTLVITGPSSGTLYLAGGVFLKQAIGVQVHRIAKSGNTVANLVGQDAALNGNASGQTRVVAALGAVPASDLVIIPLGVNDFGNQNFLAATNAQPGATPTSYAVMMKTAVNSCIANGACVLLLGEPRQNAVNYPNSMTYSEVDYWAQAKAIAQTTDHCAFLDMNDLWGSNVLGQGLGFYTANSVHPNRKGHGSMARLLHRVLSTPHGLNAAAS